MRGSSRRLIGVFAVLALLVAGGAHQHAGQTLSQGTHLFGPDHPAHAPFVPEPERPCVACALAALSAPAPVVGVLAPPLVRPAVGVRAEIPWTAPDTPEIPARAPPLSPA